MINRKLISKGTQHSTNVTLCMLKDKQMEKL